jgi:hypothetical protein
MKRLVFLFGWGMLAIVLSSCGHGTDGTTGATGKKTTKLPNKRRLDVYQVVGIVPGIKNFVIKYNDQFIRGGTPYSERGFKGLKKMDIKTIISITPTEEEREFAKKYGMALIEIPFETDKGPSQEDKRKFLNCFFRYNAPFYIHGIDSTARAGILGALYRIELCDCPYGKTMMEFQQLGGDMKQDQILVDSIKKI